MRSLNEWSIGAFQFDDIGVLGNTSNEVVSFESGTIRELVIRGISGSPGSTNTFSVEVDGVTHANVFSMTTSDFTNGAALNANKTIDVLTGSRVRVKSGGEATAGVAAAELIILR